MQDGTLVVNNQVPFGMNTYGVEAASVAYFGKPVAEINLSEAATLIDSLTGSISTAFDRLAQLAGQLPPDALRRGINSCSSVSLAENVLLRTTDRIHEGQAARLLREISELRVVFSRASDAARKELAALEAAQG